MSVKHWCDDAERGDTEVKIKVSPSLAVRAQKKGSGTAALISNLSARKSDWSTRSSRLIPETEPLSPLYRGMGGP
jgi:hypothetical protein